MNGRQEASETQPRGSRLWRGLRHPFTRRVLTYLVSIIVLLALWQLTSGVVHAIKGRALLPGPFQAFSELIRSIAEIQHHFWVSAGRLVLAMLIALGLGYPLGLLVGHERRLDQFVSPMIYITYPIPQVAFILFLFLVFGIGNAVKVAIVAVALFFQLLVSARGAAKNISQEYITSVLSAGATRRQVYWHVLLPATLPDILTSLRVSVGLGMAFLYIAETSAALGSGLGRFVKGSMYRPALASAGIVAMAALGLLLYLLIDVLERLACRWKYTQQRPR
ncbi:MAG: ABC transporter permease subunit [Candidatus Bipolaricaulota bacterium]|nr:MAG: ABC transporter permease subunit [Candidatus Bipolaricaulota bacterium]